MGGRVGAIPSGGSVHETRHVVVGQGYVGLPLAREMVRRGLPTVGLDVDERVSSGLNAGRSHVDDVSDNDLREMLATGYHCETDPAVLDSAATVVICVPTPLGNDGEPDLESVEQAVRMVASRVSGGALISLESTTYPGTTDDFVLPAIEAAGLELDKDFFLAYSPERVDPGNGEYGIRNTPKIVGGVSEESRDKAAAFYGQFIDRIVLTRGAREAEAAKLLENTYRHVNIALINEMARLCAAMDIDIWDVVSAASTKPFGFQAFYPGPGVGGHCIPVDPHYFSYEVRRRLGRPFRFVELARDVNDSMPAYVVDRVRRVLSGSGKLLQGAKVLLLGMTYKANVADLRESPSLLVAELFCGEGAEVSFHDPLVDEVRIGRETLSRVPGLDAAVAEADIVVLLQAHRAYDIDALVQASARFFDTRGVTAPGAAVRL